MNLVHEGGGEDDLVVNWHAAANQPRVSPLSIYSQVTIVTVPTGGKEQSDFDCIIITQIRFSTMIIFGKTKKFFQIFILKKNSLKNVLIGN